MSHKNPASETHDRYSILNFFHFVPRYILHWYQGLGYISKVKGGVFFTRGRGYREGWNFYLKLVPLHRPIWSPGVHRSILNLAVSVWDKCESESSHAQSVSLTPVEALFIQIVNVFRLELRQERTRRSQTHIAFFFINRIHTRIYVF